jgi:hypothetical protein
MMSFSTARPLEKEISGLQVTISGDLVLAGVGGYRYKFEKLTSVSAQSSGHVRFEFHAGARIWIKTRFAALLARRLQSNSEMLYFNAWRSLVAEVYGDVAKNKHVTDTFVDLNIVDMREPQAPRDGWQKRIRADVQVLTPGTYVIADGNQFSDWEYEKRANALAAAKTMVGSSPPGTRHYVCYVSADVEHAAPKPNVIIRESGNREREG